MTLTVPRLTKQQAGIIGAFTGVTCGPFSDVHEYVDGLPGFAGIGTISFASKEVAAQIKEAARADFLAICHDDAAPAEPAPHEPWRYAEQERAERAKMSRGGEPPAIGANDVTADPPADDLCARLNAWAYDDTDPRADDIRKAAARIAALTEHDNHTSAVLRAAERDYLARIAALREMHIDDDGTVWYPPTAWAYCVTVKYGHREHERAEAAEARCEELETDAARYRWLIANAVGYGMHMGAVLYTPELVTPRGMTCGEADAAIDAARKAGGE